MTHATIQASREIGGIMVRVDSTRTMLFEYPVAWDDTTRNAWRKKYLLPINSFARACGIGSIKSEPNTGTGAPAPAKPRAKRGRKVVVYMEDSYFRRQFLLKSRFHTVCLDFKRCTDGHYRPTDYIPERYVDMFTAIDHVRRSLNKVVKLRMRLKEDDVRRIASGLTAYHEFQSASLKDIASI